MLFGCVFGSQAQGTAPVATKKRAQHLSNRMIKDLRLNNYQANKLRDINEEKIARMQAIEAQYASNAAAANRDCQGVCRDTEKELEQILSTEQYSKYIGKRKSYFMYDKLYAANPEITDAALEAKIKEEIKAENLATRQRVEAQEKALAANSNKSSGSSTATAATP